MATAAMASAVMMNTSFFIKSPTCAYHSTHNFCVSSTPKEYFSTEGFQLKHTAIEQCRAAARYSFPCQ